MKAKTTAKTYIQKNRLERHGSWERSGHELTDLSDIYHQSVMKCRECGHSFSKRQHTLAAIGYPNITECPNCGHRDVGRPSSKNKKCSKCKTVMVLLAHTEDPATDSSPKDAETN